MLIYYLPVKFLINDFIIILQVYAYVKLGYVFTLCSNTAFEYNYQFIIYYYEYFSLLIVL